MEELAYRFDGENIKFKFHRRELKDLMRLKSYIHLGCILDACGMHPGYKVHTSGMYYEIEAPILLELQSRDFKTARTLRAQTAPKSKIKIKNKSMSTLAFDFEEIYNIYPRKKGKKPGLAACPRFIKDYETFSLAKKAATDLRNKYEKSTKEDQGYFQYFSTWVNQEAWLEFEDDQAPLEKKITIKTCTGEEFEV